MRPLTRQAIIVGLIIALVPKLHGLFYVTPSAGIPTAPDGNAPLAILMECVGHVRCSCSSLASVAVS